MANEVFVVQQPKERERGEKRRILPHANNGKAPGSPLGRWQEEPGNAPNRRPPPGNSRPNNDATAAAAAANSGVSINGRTGGAVASNSGAGGGSKNGRCGSGRGDGSDRARSSSGGGDRDGGGSSSTAGIGNSAIAATGGRRATAEASDREVITEGYIGGILLGRARVSKRYAGFEQPCIGDVVAFNSRTNYFRIHYDDDDEEEMGEKQLRRYLVPGTSGPGNNPLPPKPKRVRSRKKKRGEDASLQAKVLGETKDGNSAGVGGGGGGHSGSIGGNDRGRGDGEGGGKGGGASSGESATVVGYTRENITRLSTFALRLAQQPRPRAPRTGAPVMPPPMYEPMRDDMLMDFRNRSREAAAAQPKEPSANAFASAESDLDAAGLADNCKAAVVGRLETLEFSEELSEEFSVNAGNRKSSGNSAGNIVGNAADDGAAAAQDAVDGKIVMENRIWRDEDDVAADAVAAVAPVKTGLTAAEAVEVDLSADDASAAGDATAAAVEAISMTQVGNNSRAGSSSGNGGGGGVAGRSGRGTKAPAAVEVLGKRPRPQSSDEEEEHSNRNGSNSSSSSSDSDSSSSSRSSGLDIEDIMGLKGGESSNSDSDAGSPSGASDEDEVESQAKTAAGFVPAAALAAAAAAAENSGEAVGNMMSDAKFLSSSACTILATSLPAELRTVEAVTEFFQRLGAAGRPMSVYLLQGGEGGAYITYKKERDVKHILRIKRTLKTPDGALIQIQRAMAVKAYNRYFVEERPKKSSAAGDGNVGGADGPAAAAFRGANGKGKVLLRCDVCCMPGHSSWHCPNQVCNVCLGAGHLSVTCHERSVSGIEAAAARAAAAICIDCGEMEHTPFKCAGATRAMPGPKSRCVSCGEAGHAACKEALDALERLAAPLPGPEGEDGANCCNCGTWGHVHTQCDAAGFSKSLSVAEIEGQRKRQSFTGYGGRKNGFSGGGNGFGWRGNGYGGRDRNSFAGRGAGGVGSSGGGTGRRHSDGDHVPINKRQRFGSFDGGSGGGGSFDGGGGGGSKKEQGMKKRGRGGKKSASKEKLAKWTAKRQKRRLDSQLLNAA